jgi:hypothetical protein
VILWMGFEAVLVPWDLSHVVLEGLLVFLASGSFSPSIVAMLVTRLGIK